MNHQSTSERFKEILIEQLRTVPPNVVVYTALDGATWTASQMADSIDNSFPLAEDLSWFQQFIYTSLLRYRANESI